MAELQPREWHGFFPTPTEGGTMSPALTEIQVDPHPLLDLGVIAAELPESLGEGASPPWLNALLDLNADTPLERDERVRAEARNLLRHGGYKPTGRGKPASEYLVRAATEGGLRSINLAVDICNVVSLHSGLPISVVDRDRVDLPLRVGLADTGEEYVFNASGQTITLSGLLCLHDATGPCASGVKDSQRTKTNDDTRRMVSLVWGTTALAGRTAAAVTWYRDLLQRAGATVTTP